MLVFTRIKKVKFFIVHPVVHFVTFGFAHVLDLLITVVFSHSKSLKSQGFRFFKGTFYF